MARRASPRPAAPDGGRAPVVRELRADEAEALWAFYNGLSREVRRLFRPLGWEASLEQCDAICRATGGPARHDLVLDADGRIVGWAFLRNLESEAADLGIGIAEHFAGRGFGRQMMETLIRQARSRGARAIGLCHVADNERAHGLYESCGFVTTGSFRGDDGLDYLRMRLTLLP